MARAGVLVGWVAKSQPQAPNSKSRFMWFVYVGDSTPAAQSDYDRSSDVFVVGWVFEAHGAT